MPFDIYYAITFIISLAIFSFILEIPGVITQFLILKVGIKINLLPFY